MRQMTEMSQWKKTP